MRLINPIFIVLELIIFIGLLLYLYINQLNIPVYDEWELASLVEYHQEGTLNISVLNAPHNECRMLYPHLINLGIILLSKWQSFYLIAFNMTLLLVFYMIFKKNITSIVGSKNVIINILLLGCMMMVFSFKNYEGMISGFILCHYLMMFTAFLSFIILQKITWRNILISCFLAHISTLSYATGLLTWICIMLIILLSSIEKKSKIRFILFIALCMIIQLFLYFSDYHSSSGLTQRTFNPLKIIPYSLSFLSNNLASNSIRSIVLTIIQLFSIISATYLTYKFDKGKIYKLTPYLIFGFLGILISLTTAYGRASEGVEQSLAKRYCALSLPFTLLFFVSLLINFEYLNHWKTSKYSQNIFSGIVCFGLLYLIYIQVRFIKQADIKNQEILGAKELVLRSDYSNQIVKDIIYPYPEGLESKIAILKRHHLSLYKR